VRPAGRRIAGKAALTLALDTPLEPVTGLAEGETPWRSTTTACEAVRARRALNGLSAPG
jgi:hypothetical protein